MNAPSPFMVMHSMTADRSVLDGKELTKQTRRRVMSVSYTHLRAHETSSYLV